MSVVSDIELHQVILRASDDVAFSASTSIPDFRKTHLNHLKQACIGETVTSNLESTSTSFKVVSCLPVEQGNVTEKTEIVIIEPNRTESIFAVDETPAPLFFSSFLPHNLQSQSKGTSFYTTGLDAAKSMQAVWDVSGEASVTDGGDDGANVFVSLDGLRALGIVTGTWVVLSSQDNFRLARLRLHPSAPLTSSQIALTPQLLFGLRLTAMQQITVLVSRWNGSLPLRHSADPWSSAAPLSDNTSPPNVPRATEITVAPIAIPSPPAHLPPIDHRRIYQAVGHYFSRTRLFAKGDIFAVRVSHFDNALSQSSDMEHAASQTPGVGRGTGDMLAYFEIQQVVPGGNEMLIGNVSWMDVKKGKECMRAVAPLLPSYMRGSLGDHRVMRDLPAYERLFEALQPTVAPIGAPPVFVMLHGPIGSGKKSLTQAAADRLGMHLHEVSCLDIVNEAASRSAASLSEQCDLAIQCAPCVLYLSDLDSLCTAHSHMPGKQAELVASVFATIIATSRRGVAVVGSATALHSVLPPLRAIFLSEIQVTLPGEPQRLAILKQLFSHVVLAPSAQVLLEETAARLAGTTPRALFAFQTATCQSALVRGNDILTTAGKPVGDIQLAKSRLVVTVEDIEYALNTMKTRTAAAIGTPKVPEVRWDDVGGLMDVKREILDTVQLPLRHPHLFADGVRKRSGVMLFGPPGTGKTLLAKAVATECGLTFLSVKGPELINKYIGESEKNVRDVFQKARDAKPCVIFFDELDALAPARGGQGDSGGVMDRIVSQLLAELDGMQGNNDVFVVAATNRPDLVDAALLRPGRFDRMLYVGISPDRTGQLKVISALTRKFHLAEDVQLEHVVEKLPARMTGADLYAVCADALQSAINARAAQISETCQTTGQQPAAVISSMSPADLMVYVTQSDFIAAASRARPSVSEEDVAMYEQLRTKIQGAKKR